MARPCPSSLRCLNRRTFSPATVGTGVLRDGPGLRCRLALTVFAVLARLLSSSRAPPAVCPLLRGWGRLKSGAPLPPPPAITPPPGWEPSPPWPGELDGTGAAGLRGGAGGGSG